MISTTLDALLSLSRSIELSILLKATAMLALGLMAARLAGRAQASIRHLLLAATFGTLVALPLIVFAVPAVTIQVPVATASTPLAFGREARTSTGFPANTSAGQRDEKPGSRAWTWTSTSWPATARWGWIAGTTALCLSLLMGVWRVSRTRRHSLPRPELRELAQSLAREAGIRRPVEVLEHEDLLAPLTCGLRRPAILFPATARDWEEAEVRRALVHELEHVRRGDWAVQLAARTVSACYWFHPLVWMALRRLCLEAERACDDAVVRGAERTDYADQLVLLARRLSAAHAPAMLGMANRSDLSARVAALLDDRQRRGRAGLFAAASAVIAAGLVVMTIAPVRAVAILSPIVDASDEQRSRRDNTELRVKAIDRALYEAAENGDLADIDQLLQAGANVNAVVPGDGSPLIGGARTGRVSVVRHLLDRGADVNMPVEGDGNPLIAAANEGALKVVELLLDRGANVDQIVPGDETALIQASGEGHLEVVRLLVARGADVNLGVWAEHYADRPQKEWRSPLSMARRGRHASVVELLVAAGARE